jgi:hypothetical protein
VNDRNPGSSELRTDGDWWYGASAAFPKAVEWHTWFDHHKDRIGGLQPIERFLVDATTKLQQTYVKIAQRVRKNERWTRNYTEDEMADIKAVAEEACAWYNRSRPREDQIRNLDPMFLLMFKALDGAYAVALRLANELHTINERGFVLVDMSAESRELSV